MGRPSGHSDLTILVVLEMAPSARMAARELGMSRPALKNRCRRLETLMAAYEAARSRGEPRRGNPARARALSGVSP